MADNDVEVQKAFVSKIKEILAIRPNTWSGADSAELVQHCTSVMKNEKGENAEISEEDVDVITVMSRPTQELQMQVLQRIYAKYGLTLGPKVFKRIGGAINAPTFKMEMVKSGVIKDTRDNGLGDLLS